MRLYAGCRIAPQKLSRLARTWGGQPQPAPLGRLHPHMCPGTRSQKKKKKKMHVTPAQLQTQIRDLRALLCFNYMRCNPSSGLPPAVPCRRVKATLLPGTQPSCATRPLRRRITATVADTGVDGGAGTNVAKLAWGQRWLAPGGRASSSSSSWIPGLRRFRELATPALRFIIAMGT